MVVLLSILKIRSVFSKNNTDSGVSSVLLMISTVLITPVPTSRTSPGNQSASASLLVLGDNLHLKHGGLICVLPPSGPYLYKLNIVKFDGRSEK